MNVIKLTEKNHQQIMDLVLPQASLNLFIIGDIELYGYDKDFQEIWGQFETDGITLKAILLRYYHFFIIYGKKDYDANSFAVIINGYEKAEAVSGEQAIIKTLLPFLTHDMTQQDTFFAECKKESLTADDNQLKLPIQIATPDDAAAIVTMVRSIAEFNITEAFDDHVTRLAKSILDKAGRTYFVKENGHIISLTSSTAENTQSAMIVGVCTQPAYRHQGYTSTLLSKMLIDLFEEKETVCLFYDNPKAGSIYKRLGFYDIGRWTMLKIKHQ